jgi:hypothetical protein
LLKKEKEHQPPFYRTDISMNWICIVHINKLALYCLHFSHINKLFSHRNELDTKKREGDEVNWLCFFAYQQIVMKREEKTRD